VPSSDSTLLLYLAATLLICLSPGPNVMLMISFGLRDGRPSVLRAVAGVVTASLLFLVVSALGVAAALHASTTLFAVVRYAGAAYLVYLGVRLLVAAARAADVPPPVGAAVSAQPQRTRTGAYWQGLVTHLSNPKAILFWGALLPQFLDTGRAVARQIVFLGLLGIAMDAVVLTAYGLAAAAARHFAPTQAFTRWIDAAAGSFFVLTGALLAFAHRS
jgi:threonine/homoserine/homoserine lactone efflux protein